MTDMDRNVAFDNSERQICVAQVIGTFRIADGGGGAQRLANHLAVGLSKLGIRSIAIALRVEGPVSESTTQEVMFVPFGANTRRPLTLLKAFVGLRALIRRQQIDLLHIHGATSLPFVVLATRMLRRAPRLVFTWQDSGSVLGQTGWRRKLMVWALRQCDAVSGSSRAVAQALQTRTGLDQVGVFHGGVPIGPEPRIEVTSSPLIIWIGRIVPPKDPLILIRAAAALKNEGLDFKVYVIGEPHVSSAWYMNEARDLVEQLDVKDRVVLTGFMLDNDLEMILRRAEISVQTSHTEGMSIALMEQMMSGLAIVATDVGDTAVAIEDDISGIIIPPKDDKRLIDALRRILESLELRKRFSAAARLRAVNEFSISAMSTRAAKQYYSLIRRM